MRAASTIQDAPAMQGQAATTQVTATRQESSMIQDAPTIQGQAFKMQVTATRQETSMMLC